MDQNVMSKSLPKIGILGVGWIGRHRMESLAKSALVEIGAVADPCRDSCLQACRSAPGAVLKESLQDLLALPLDGIVIATPSSQHAEQAAAALKAGFPVFCQKPLALDAESTRSVVAAAKSADRLLGVDLSYRFLSGLSEIRKLADEGAVGRIYAVDLVFHNAYGPDKSWYYDVSTAGGGCLLDLGAHLVDLMLGVLNYPQRIHVGSHLFAGGKPLLNRGSVEDYAAVQMIFRDNARREDISVSLACSWNLQAGCEAVFRAVFYGSEGGLCIRNVDGSFYRFQAEKYNRTACEALTPASDDWWGAAAVQWARTLRKSNRFDPEVESVIPVAETLDAIYEAGTNRQHTTISATVA